jgi:hypothetical protein
MASSTVVASRGTKRLVASKRKDITALDNEFFGEVVGVAQAVGALRKALSELSASLDGRQFEKASALGYGKIAEEFVFLQRTLGGLQGACMQKEKLVSDLAAELRCSYEDVLPEVDAIMQSARPRGRKRHGANRTKRSRIRAAIKAMIDKAEGATPEIRTAQPPQRGGFT